MNNDNLLIVLIITVMLVLFFASNYFVVQSHENAHAQIGKTYGCLESETIVTAFGGTYECLDKSHVRSDQENLAHNFNDVVQYHLNALLNIVMVWVIFLVSIYLLMRLEL